MKKENYRFVLCVENPPSYFILVHLPREAHEALQMSK